MPRNSQARLLAPTQGCSTCHIPVLNRRGILTSTRRTCSTCIARKDWKILQRTRSSGGKTEVFGEKPWFGVVVIVVVRRRFVAVPGIPVQPPPHPPPPSATPQSSFWRRPPLQIQMIDYRNPASESSHHARMQDPSLQLVITQPGQSCLLEVLRSSGYFQEFPGRAQAL